MKHTPAPWKVQNPRHFPNKENAHYFIVNGDALVSIMPELQSNRTEESEANARLIAAAPELLEIVEELGRFITNIENGFKPSTEDTISAFKFIAPQVRAAIAKAEG